MTATPFEVSINPLWPGQKLKPTSEGETRWGRHTGAWRTEGHSLESFAQRICQDGYAFCAVLKSPWRKEANFKSLQVLASDHDGAALDVLQEDVFIRDHAALIYETPSSTPDSPRSRAVFVLDRPITDPARCQLAYRALIHHFSDGAPDIAADKACKDPTRFFYGRPNARHVVLGNILYADTLQEIIELYGRGAPGLFPGSETSDMQRQPHQYEDYNPHWGVPLSDDDRQRLAQELEAAGLTLCGDRFNGPCILPHRNGPCDCPGAMYVSLITGAWHCFCGDHLGRDHGGVRVLRLLGGNHSGAEGGAQPSGGATAAKERRRALVEARMTALFGARGAYAARLRKAGDVDLHTLTQLMDNGYVSQHRLRLEAFDDIPILLEDPRHAPGMDDLFALRCQVEPRATRDLEEEQYPRGARLLQTCGWAIDATCEDHGVRFSTRRSCRLLDHAPCPTQATERIRVLTLPDAPVGGNYRALWLGVPFDLPPDDGGQAVAAVADHVAKTVQRVARRKVGSGLLSRSASFVMARTASACRVKLVFQEQVAGDATVAINELCAALGATVLGDKKLTTADLAVLQLVEDTMYHLAGLESPDSDLYAAWFFGVRGRRLFQSYGLLFGKLAEGWVKGETTIDAGADQAPVEHGLGTQVIVEAQPLGFRPKGWRSKGRCDQRSWVVYADTVKLNRRASRSLTFAWRARQDATPVCDICGEPLKMVLEVPSGAEAANVGGDRWGPGRGKPGRRCARG